MTLGTSSYWMDSASVARFPSLDRDLAVDVVVIGGGITGVTAAYLLKRAGRRVALLERGRCGAIDTGHTTAHLTCVTDTPITDLIRTFGEDHARAACDAGLAAIACIDEIVRREKIACEFSWVPGYLHLPAGREAAETGADELRKQADAAAALGFDARYVASVPFMDRPGIEFDQQARFHPRKYLAAIVALIDGDGSQVFEHTAADEVHDDPLSVQAGAHRVRCTQVVVATHNPIVGKAGILSASFLQTKLALYTSYAVGGRVPPDRVPDALFWDTDDPYRYVRVERHRGFDYVIVGGEDHKTGQATDTRQCFARLRATATALLPDLDITHEWSGQVLETADGLPFIGEMAPQQFAATGFSGNGMTFGTLGAMMACDAVTGTRNPWTGLFDIGRTRIRGGLWDYLRENADYPYYLIRDRFAGVQGRSLRAVPRGAGKVLDLDGAKVAAFRDRDGSVTTRSAVCTHMGCLVRWNDAERSWDCPCHGSRFAPNGAVLAGPAETPLSEVPAMKSTSSTPKSSKSNPPSKPSKTAH
jgi:glycine/D-amino acid oxidase-like deaminating enzyme/nitrite reductase/ring-hydroxylating ferredoxin subunit